MSLTCPVDPALLQQWHHEAGCGCRGAQGAQARVHQRDGLNHHGHAAWVGVRVQVHRARAWRHGVGVCHLQEGLTSDPRGGP